MKLAMAFAFVAIAALAEEKKDEAPRVFALFPIQLTAGEKTTLRLRGVKLKDATEVRVAPDAQATLKEKKDTGVPNGLEAKDVGDNEVAIELTPPEGCGKLSVEIVTPGGVTKSREVSVFPKDALVAEKEPNNGFREAQPIEPGKPLRGKIDADKDVDVFRFDAHVGKALTARVIAADAGSLLDPIISLFDTAGHLLATDDDIPGHRDPVLTFTPKTDGPLCLVVNDAHDRGGPWHEYRLEISQQP